MSTCADHIGRTNLKYNIPMFFPYFYPGYGSLLQIIGGPLTCESICPESFIKVNAAFTSDMFPAFTKASISLSIVPGTNARPLPCTGMNNN